MMPRTPSRQTLRRASHLSRCKLAASSIASTTQQMSISFGVAVASLAAALFIPDRFHSTAAEFISGIHKAFLLLSGLTILSTLVFRELRSTDGSLASRHEVVGEAHLLRRLPEGATLS